MHHQRLRQVAMWAAVATFGIAAGAPAARPSTRTVSLAGWTVPGTIAMRPLNGGRVLIQWAEPSVSISGQGEPPTPLVLDPVALTLAPPSGAERIDESAPPTLCDGGSTSLPTGVVMDAGGAVFVAGRALDISGRSRRLCADSGGQWVSVLSAVGIPVPSWSPLPALGRGDRIFGWRYHQAFALSDGHPVGPRVELGFWRDDPHVCCAPNAPVVVYADPLFASVTLVRVDQ